MIESIHSIHMEMKEDEVLLWQKYFLEHDLEPAFCQMDEPVYRRQDFLDYNLFQEYIHLDYMDYFQMVSAYSDFYV